MADFWLSCGHHLLDREAGGGLAVTDEFFKVYLARPLTWYVGLEAEATRIGDLIWRGGEVDEATVAQVAACSG
jgi:hypothetical protein